MLFRCLLDSAYMELWYVPDHVAPACAARELERSQYTNIEGWIEDSLHTYKENMDMRFV